MRLLITAGPTREALDPVRFLTNRSSGRMGYALAQAALDQGHEVLLISGPVCLRAPDGAQLHKVESAQEMLEAVQAMLPSVEIGIFAAAVADYRPVAKAAQKIKKNNASLSLELERTPDILGSARAMGFAGLLVGFAAETENLIEQAQAKLARKGCDLMLANDVSRPGLGFDSADNALSLCLPDGRVEHWPPAPKAELAARLIPFIVALAASRANSKPC